MGFSVTGTWHYINLVYNTSMRASHFSIVSGVLYKVLPCRGKVISYIDQILSCVCTSSCCWFFCETFAIPYEHFKHFFVFGSSHTTPNHLLSHTCSQKYNMHLKKEHSSISTLKVSLQSRMECKDSVLTYSKYLCFVFATLIFNLQTDFPYLGTEKLSAF